MTDGTVFFLIILFSIICFAPYFIGESNRKSNNERIRNKVFSGDFIPADELEREWVVKGFGGNYGSKYSDGPGCYIILMFNAPVVNSDYSNYINGYIGQSINVCARVHNHLNGKGNGDVYADRKNGKYLYVKIIKCETAELNDLETRLIASFDWDRLYNRSRGGGSKHQGISDKKYSGDFESATKDTKHPIKSSNVNADPKPKQTNYQSIPDPSRSSGNTTTVDIDSLKSKALSGDVNAQYRLGWMYELGSSVNKDPYYAAMWYKMAVENHHRKATIQLAKMYRDGRGVPKDYGVAMKTLEPLISEGDETAISLARAMPSDVFD